MSKQKMIIKKIFLSILFSIFLLATFSCATLPINLGKTQKEQIRIVDINGRYRPIERHTPALNSQFIRMQEEQAQRNTVTNPTNIISNPSRNDVADFNNDLGPSSEPLIEQGENEEEQAIEYDFEKEKEKGLILEEKKKKPAKVIYKASKDTSLKGIFIQIGYYGSKSGAKRTLDKGKNLSSGLVKDIKTGNKIMYKVLLGPITNKSEGKILLNKARNKGFKDAFIITIK